MMTLALVAAVLSLAPQDASAPPSRQIGVHTGGITHLAVSPDGGALVTAAPGEIHAWDLKKEKALWKVSVAATPIVALGVGEELVVYHTGDVVISMFELDDGDRRTAVAGYRSTRASRCLVVDPRDRWVWVGTDTGSATRLIPENVKGWSNRPMGNGGSACLAQDAKGNILAIGGRDKTIRFINAKSCNPDKKKVFDEHNGVVSALALDPKGKLVISGSEIGELKIWKYANGKVSHELQTEGALVLHLTVDPKGKLLASGDADGVIKLWSLKKGELLMTLPGSEEGPVSGLAFLDKGKTLATSRGTPLVTLWDLSDI